MTSKVSLPSVLLALQDVSLVDAATCAAAGGVSLSWWYEKVANGDAPKPVVRLPRCTRWRLTDVIGFWSKFAELAASDTQVGDQVTARARKASAAARTPAALAKARATRGAIKAAGDSKAAV